MLLNVFSNLKQTFQFLLLKHVKSLIILIFYALILKQTQNVLCKYLRIDLILLISSIKFLYFIVSGILKQIISRKYVGIRVFCDIKIRFWCNVQFLRNQFLISIYKLFILQKIIIEDYNKLTPKYLNSLPQAKLFGFLLLFLKHNLTDNKQLSLNAMLIRIYTSILK